VSDIDLVVEERLVITNAIEREAQNYMYWGDPQSAEVLLRIVAALKEGRI
jgi:hypothetical protein